MHLLTFNDLFQTVAAFLIFVIGYLALIVALIACVVTAVSVYRGARLLWSYTIRFCATNNRFTTETRHLAISSACGSRRESRHCERAEIPALELSSAKL